MIPQDFIHLLLDRVDIVEVVERYVPLKKKGANYQACCPFHNEKTPSFTVSPTKQFYHCFGCGAHGTAISFLMEHAGLDFPEAVRDLAARVGLTVPDDGQGRKPEDGRRDAQGTAMENAARFYREQLKTSDKAIAYLRGRGLTGETAARFALGYAPDEWQGLARAGGDYQDEVLEEVGLVIAGEGKRYDRFRDRVMFPIRNERGRIIAFGGRVMASGEPKYLNSPETPLFHKGRELYGLHEHRRAIQGENRVLVVEGYMDVVMLDQQGVQNAVATLGTAITPDHVTRLLRLADEVIFAFDGDNAGRKAAWRALENSLPQARDGKLLSFLFLPEGEDPDSFVQAQGSEAFRKLCDKATPLSDFLFAELSSQTDLSSQEGKVRLATLAKPHLAKLTQAPMLARALHQRLGALTGLEAPRSARDSRQHTSNYPSDKQADFQARRPQGRSAVQPSAWRVVLQAVLHDPARAGTLPELPESAQPEAQTLHALVSLAREHPEMRARDIVEHFRGRPEQAVLEPAAAELLKLGDDYDVEADFQGALGALLVQAGRAAVKTLSDRRPSELTPEEKARLLASLKTRKPS